MNKTGRASEALTPQELKAFNKWIATFFVKADAAKELGVTMPTFERVRFMRRGSPATIAKIREVINQVTA